MLRALTSLALLVLLGGAGYYAWERFTEHERLLARLGEQRQVIERLSGSSRVAQAMVAERWSEDGRVLTRIRFVEVGEDGAPLSSKEVVVEGETVYFDALVLKFDHEYVGAGDSVKGKSILLFRRVFGEHQKPVDGAKLDEAGIDGLAESELWERFWEYANDPNEARKAGVRVAQGEAPYTRMEEGKIYNLTLDHAGGLNISPSPLPAVLMQGDG
ncbi:MAG: hypothetical protein HY812_04970 [Planctomycetes bacterium]|nr:hypothetical protein [Planctomycetota bacterium]